MQGCNEAKKHRQSGTTLMTVRECSEFIFCVGFLRIVNEQDLARYLDKKKPTQGASAKVTQLVTTLSGLSVEGK